MAASELSRVDSRESSSTCGACVGCRSFRKPTSVFANCPYGNLLRACVERIDHQAQAGATVVALLPGQRFEQRYVQEILLDPGHTIIEVPVAGRVSFYARVCTRCDELESHKGHKADAKPAERCVGFVWGGERREGLGNPYGSFLYLLGPGHDQLHAREVFREVGCVRKVEWCEPFAPVTGGPRARAGKARKVKASAKPAEFTIED